MGTPGRPPTATGPHRVRPMRWVRRTATRASPATATRHYQVGVTWRRAKPSPRPAPATPPGRVVAPQRARSMATSRTQPTTAPMHVTRPLATTPFFIPGSRRTSPACGALLSRPPKPETRGRDPCHTSDKSTGAADRGLIDAAGWCGAITHSPQSLARRQKKDPKHATALRITRTPGESSCFLHQPRNEPSHSMAIV
jgi:hypothetical protein